MSSPEGRERDAEQASSGVEVEQNAGRNYAEHRLHERPQQETIPLEERGDVTTEPHARYPAVDGKVKDVADVGVSASGDELRRLGSGDHQPGHAFQVEQPWQALRIGGARARRELDEQGPFAAGDVLAQLNFPQCAALVAETPLQRLQHLLGRCQQLPRQRGVAQIGAVPSRKNPRRPSRTCSRARMR